MSTKKSLIDRLDDESDRLYVLYKEHTCSKCGGGSYSIRLYVLYKEHTCSKCGGGSYSIPSECDFGRELRHKWEDAEVACMKARRTS